MRWLILITLLLTALTGCIAPHPYMDPYYPYGYYTQPQQPQNNIVVVQQQTQTAPATPVVYPVVQPVYQPNYTAPVAETHRVIEHYYHPAPQVYQEPARQTYDHYSPTRINNALQGYQERYWTPTQHNDGNWY